MSQPMDVSLLVPGGILASDHVHGESGYDYTCSRCRQQMSAAGPLDEDEVPVLIWPPTGGMLAYCARCQAGTDS